LTKTLDSDSKHDLVVVVTPHYPRDPPTFSAALPIPFDYEWTSTSNLKSVFAAFCAALSRFREFWSVTREIDLVVFRIRPIICGTNL
jgi:hypothetical protein